MLTHGVTLKQLNTFAIDARASHVVRVETEAQMMENWRQAQRRQVPVMLLGSGSNVLFLENYCGTILLNRIKGITVQETAEAWHLHIGAGEDWHELVSNTLADGMPGLENLALIPGCVGSAPIQNIGAYGVEFESRCEYVEVLDLASGEKIRLSKADCRFGYRESIFKHQYRDNYAIVAVGLMLSKTWLPVLTYGDLARLDPATATPAQVFDTVCHMRRTKLPDPRVTGNAGSFFKNPVISAAAAETLLKAYPGAPHYTQPDGQVKLAAGWLIDQCSLKGFRLGEAAVHDKQALVLINRGSASGRDMVALARHVRHQVADKFAIWLEPEVRFIGSRGEVNAVETLS
ncbi:UDP-N-acetylmuramate dehydrogenase [Biostraticola tofi]|uniref:UDP-N-acetylenolpyruvoylglucosamine reductase n=1 Tax=Biostraticola tofi TaxID=466109 RepID=A0A4R3YF14_9GAMM|nr:UDP-N-acetylmuramate dehydrogenase [Biostraticola tofi]TCV91115.1 UDP-N-acetylmuramate dehydrogenase [Biostraticola tofi]